MPISKVCSQSRRSKGREMENTHETRVASPYVPPIARALRMALAGSLEEFFLAWEEVARKGPVEIILRFTRMGRARERKKIILPSVLVFFPLKYAKGAEKVVEQDEGVEKVME